MGKPILTSWLINRLNSKEDISASWVNKEEKIFKILWTHKSKNNWREEVGQIFKDWSIYTQKNIIKENHSIWKTRMRCALKKSREIRKFEDEHPYKIFKIILKDAKKKVTSSHVNDKINENMNSNIPTVVDDYDGSLSASSSSSPCLQSLDLNLKISVKIYFNGILKSRGNINTLQINSLFIYPNINFMESDNQQTICIPMNEPKEMTIFISPFYYLQFTVSENDVTVKKNTKMAVYILTTNDIHQRLSDEDLHLNLSENLQFEFIVGEKPPFPIKLIKIIVSFWDYFK